MFYSSCHDIASIRKPFILSSETEKMAHSGSPFCYCQVSSPTEITFFHRWVVRKGSRLWNLPSKSTFFKVFVSTQKKTFYTKPYPYQHQSIEKTLKKKINNLEITCRVYQRGVAESIRY